MDFKIAKVSFSKKSPWCVTLTHQKKRVYRKFFTSKEKAREHVRREENKISVGTSHQEGPDIGLGGAIEKFLEDCIKVNLRPTSINTYTQRLSKFHKFIGDVKIKEITRKDIKAFAETSTNKHTRKAYRDDSAYLMNWCGQKEWIPEGGFYNITLRDVHVDEREIPIISPERGLEILRKAPNKHILRFALQMFAGLRPFESCRVTSISEDLIVIKGQEAKGRRSRTLNDLPDNLKQWIRYYEIKPCSYNAMRIARERNIGSLGHDAMRHSFCTYGYWELGQEKCMRFTSHTNHRTFHHHYVESNVSAESAKEWFSIVPDGH